ncbi:MAG: polysulfide reductase NrfD [Candidatus Eremiobacteraeota bacterium]|nr:polysulfide reductase NrfD [Candidatus Eremiobacteraeota bacterium]
MRSIPSPDDAFIGAASRNGEQRATIPTYYDHPMLKWPDWDWNVVTYLFLGGIMGGLGLIQMLARPELESERKLKRTVRVTSFVLAAANPAVLVTHLGRPERFLNMLRIMKFKSPMSLGTWGLVFYSGAAGANVIRELAVGGTLPRWMRFFAPGLMTPVQALLGAFTAGYTGVLLSSTANPFWGSGKRHIPAMSVCSGLASACALSSLLCTLEGNTEPLQRLERLEMVAGAAELFILTDFERRHPDYTKPFFKGKRGEKLRTYTMAAGTLGPIALNVLGSMFNLPKPVDALRVTAASILTLAGGYVLRESLIAAGKASARDPQAAFRQPK